MITAHMRNILASASGVREGYAIRNSMGGWWDFEIYPTREAAKAAWHKHVSHLSPPVIVKARSAIEEIPEAGEN